MENKKGNRINYSKVAKQYNCDPRTVKRYFTQRRESPCVRKKREVKKVTDGFEELIEEKFVRDNAPSISIYNLLKEKYGYIGSYQTIKKYTHNLKQQKIKEATMRFETNPGVQAQVDWKEELKLRNKSGKEFTVNIFICILGYSRLKYICLTQDRTQPTLFNCLSKAFKFFGGVPEEILFDNMRTVVDRSRTQFNKVVFNQKFYEFSKDAGFIPKSCLAYRPETKGKVEVVAKIMNRLKVYNNEFESYEELESIVNKLMNDINNEVQQTTKEKPITRFNEEKGKLRPEPNYSILEAYFMGTEIRRKVPRDNLITYKNKKYSVPPKYVNRTVSLVEDGTKLYIFYEKKLLATHNLQDKKINYIPEHYLELVGSTFTNSDLIEEICKRNLEIIDKI